MTVLVNSNNYGDSMKSFTLRTRTLHRDGLTESSYWGDFWAQRAQLAVEVLSSDLGVFLSLLGCVHQFLIGASTSKIGLASRQGAEGFMSINKI